MIDTSNDFLVGSNGEKVVIMNPPRQMTHDQALRLAAWLVAIADGEGSHKFADVLRAVQST